MNFHPISYNLQDPNKTTLLQWISHGSTASLMLGTSQLEARICHRVQTYILSWDKRT